MPAGLREAHGRWTRPWIGSTDRPFESDEERLTELFAMYEEMVD